MVAKLDNKRNGINVGKVRKSDEENGKFSNSLCDNDTLLSTVALCLSANYRCKLPLCRSARGWLAGFRAVIKHVTINELRYYVPCIEGGSRCGCGCEG